MRLVDWSQILPGVKVKVLFSALALPPHKDEIDANLVAIELPGDLFIDVEWVRKVRKYIVTLFRDDLENAISVRECKDAYEVIEVVCDFVCMAQTVNVGGGSLNPIVDSDNRPPVILEFDSVYPVLGRANA